MIISSAPFRISFSGGGSDMNYFYTRRKGAVLSSSINKYAYVALHPFFDKDLYHLKYSTNELVTDINKIKHPIIRECMKLFNINPGIEITSIADIPSGTGLGSSSTFTVALINGLHFFLNKTIDKNHLANLASIIEIQKLNEPIGKQDQYASSFGGLNLIEFKANEDVIVTPVKMSNEFKGELNSSTMLFYLGKQRKASNILTDQKNIVINDQNKQSSISEIVDLAYVMKRNLERENIQNFGENLDLSWGIKKEITSNINSPLVEKAYKLAMGEGAFGCKLAGAGGAGFLLVIASNSARKNIRSALSEYSELDFNLDHNGARIIFSE